MVFESAEAPLRSASTDFPWVDFANFKTLGGERYRLRFYVDAQNAQAIIRNDFTCEATGHLGSMRAIRDA